MHPLGCVIRTFNCALFTFSRGNKFRYWSNAEKVPYFKSISHNLRVNHIILFWKTSDSFIET